MSYETRPQQESRVDESPIPRPAPGTALSVLFFDVDDEDGEPCPPTDPDPRLADRHARG